MLSVLAIFSSESISEYLLQVIIFPVHEVCAHQVMNVIDGERCTKLISRVQPRSENDSVLATNLIQVQMAFVEG